jgi:hypothetical protein
MDREQLENLLSRDLDGALSPDERAQLDVQLDSDPEAQKLAESWHGTARGMSAYAGALGAPLPFNRSRFSQSKTQPHARRVWFWRAAASVLLAFGAGMLAAPHLGRDTGPRLALAPLERPAAVPLQDANAGDVLLRQALVETWRILPRQVSYAAMQDGKFRVSALPFATSQPPQNFYLVSFEIERATDKCPLCQVALLDGEEAFLSCRDWELRVAAVASGTAAQLQTHFMYNASGAEALLLAAAPSIQNGLIEIGSVCFGTERVVLRATIEKLPASSLEGGKNTL